MSVLSRIFHPVLSSQFPSGSLFAVFFLPTLRRFSLHFIVVFFLPVPTRKFFPSGSDPEVLHNYCSKKSGSINVAVVVCSDQF